MFSRFITLNRNFKYLRENFIPSQLQFGGGKKLNVNIVENLKQKNYLWKNITF
jgi:hypothetical protein